VLSKHALLMETRGGRTDWRRVVLLKQCDICLVAERRDEQKQRAKRKYKHVIPELEQHVRDAETLATRATEQNAWEDMLIITMTFTPIMTQTTHTRVVKTGAVPLSRRSTFLELDLHQRRVMSRQSFSRCLVLGQFRGRRALAWNPFCPAGWYLPGATCEW
jgi:hypothetical protein